MYLKGGHAELDWLMLMSCIDVKLKFGDPTYLLYSIYYNIITIILIIHIYYILDIVQGWMMNKQMITSKWSVMVH